MSKDIKKSISNIVKSTTNDLINGKYKLIEIGEYTSKVTYRGNVLDIWIANGAGSCSIHSKIEGLEFPEFDKETKRIVYKLATTKTDYMIKCRLREARKVHRESFLKYKESILLVKSLKEELRAELKQK